LPLPRMSRPPLIRMAIASPATTIRKASYTLKDRGTTRQD
jgi:hypothetical protein